MVSGGAPAEVDSVGLGIIYSGGIALTPDGQYVYVGGLGSWVLVKVDVPAMDTTESFSPGPSYIWDIAMDENGIAYLGAFDEWEILTWDTNSDVAGSPIPMGMSELANDLLLEDGKLYISNAVSYNTGATGYGGALTIADTSLRWSQYDNGYDDDSSYDVTLPFTLTFLGDTYDTITFNSNGVLGLDGTYDYDTGIADILGFSPNNENLDSGDSYFNYSHRSFADHVVFQWCTATNDNSTASSTVTVFEAVVYDDNRVRFDYLFSMPGAINEDDGYGYGVGDRNGTAVVDLRQSKGSPFDLRRRSFLWDPATSTTTMPEVSFQWEGSGAVHLPLVNVPHGIALTDKYIFLPCPKNGYSSATDTSVV